MILSDDKLSGTDDQSEAMQVENRQGPTGKEEQEKKPSVTYSLIVK